MVAGVQSGCGKTSLTLALLQYMQGRRQPVAPFKAGPDFLDPLWHQAVTGHTSYNLDTRMMGEAQCRDLFAAKAGDHALIEGVMGLFDGRSGVGEAGSSAHLAHTLGVPVCLVVDAKGMSGSLVPLVSGFVQQARQMGVRISGILANRVGSSHHAELLEGLLSDYQLPPLVAWMAKGAPALPERHLGLQRPEEVELPDFSQHFHVNETAMETAWGETILDDPCAESEQGLLAGHTIAIARDAAACFCYPANLDWLRRQGAELCFFSPLAGEAVPTWANALWLPGGYPELYAEALSRSATWPSLRQFIDSGRPVLAECGGMMLLGEDLVDHAGRHWPMAGVLPMSTRMQDRLAALGYREDASGARGHEFHHSVRETESDLSPAFNVSRGDAGMRYKNLRASYVHWYFPSAPQVVAGWLGNMPMKAVS
jgi:cobyrinic acid a,c-diamide synthase